MRVPLVKQRLIGRRAKKHMSNSVEYILLGDIGATNARFAVLSNGKLNAIHSFEVAKFGQFTDLLANFLKEHCRQTQISGKRR
jgi:glucokinase